MILPFALVLLQSSGQTPPEDAIRALESVLSQPAFAEVNALYLRDRSKGYTFQIYKSIWEMSWAEASIYLSRPSGRILAIHHYTQSQSSISESPALGNNQLIRIATELQSQAEPEVTRPHLKVSSLDGRTFMINFRRDFGGYPVGDPVVIDLDRYTGRFNRFYLAPLIDVSKLDTKRFLPIETLREMTLGAYVQRGAFPQAEILSEEVEISGQPDPNRPKADKYGELSFPLLPAPKFQMVLMDSEDGGRVVAGADAITGRAWASEKVLPFGSSTLRPGALPKEVVFGGVRGGLTSIGKSAAKPGGDLVFVSSGKTLFTARLDSKLGLLWIRRTRKEAYKAFRPDPKLRQALAVQTRRNPKPNSQT